jgi:cobalt-zinc-cadmium efflux system membrane fusion protein
VSDNDSQLPRKWQRRLRMTNNRPSGRPLFVEAARALLAAFAVIVAAGGCEQTQAPAAKATAESAPKKGQPVKLAPVQKEFLTIEAVEAADVGQVLSLPGRTMFHPQAQFYVGATTAGRVSALLVRSGQAVTAGTPLLTIDSADASSARAALEQAATRLATAENVYRRNVEMVDKGVGLEIERQEAEARLKEARSEHDRARHAVTLLGAGQGSRVTVRAPANGVVMAIKVGVGAMVAPGGEALLEMGDPTRLQVVAQVVESDLSRIVAGQRAEVDLPALATRISAHVDSINARVDPEMRRAQVYLALDKKPEKLRAGMLAQIALHTSGAAGIWVPVAAVLIKEGKRRVVYIEDADGGFTAREVKTGRQQDGRVQILSGLAAGDKVVVQGALLLDTQAEQLL